MSNDKWKMIEFLPSLQPTRFPMLSSFYLSRDECHAIKGDAMLAIRKTAFLFAVLTGTLFLTACPSQTNIGKINRDPGRYRDKEVGIVGRVTDSYGVLGNGAYEIDDGTGKMWVVTKRGVPSRGARVGTKGYVHTGFSFAGRTFGTVLEETDRHSKGR